MPKCRTLAASSLATDVRCERSPRPGEWPRANERAAQPLTQLSLSPFLAQPLFPFPLHPNSRRTMPMLPIIVHICAPRPRSGRARCYSPWPGISYKLVSATKCAVTAPTGVPGGFSENPQWRGSSCWPLGRSAWQQDRIAMPDGGSEGTGGAAGSSHGIICPSVADAAPILFVLTRRAQSRAGAVRAPCCARQLPAPPPAMAAASASAMSAAAAVAICDAPASALGVSGGGHCRGGSRRRREPRRTRWRWLWAGRGMSTVEKGSGGREHSRIRRDMRLEEWQTMWRQTMS